MNYITQIVISITIIFSVLVSSCNRKQHIEQQKLSPEAAQIVIEKEERISNAIDKNPEAIAKSTKFHDALVTAVKKNPMLLFQDLNLNKVQDRKISKLLDKHKFAEIAFQPNANSNPSFTKIVSKVKKVLTDQQNVQFAETLKKLN